MQTLHLPHSHAPAQLPTPSSQSSLPEIILIEPKHGKDTPQLIHYWKKAIKTHFPSDSDVQSPFTVIEGRLEEVKTKVSCMVSPANSFGIMDGGYDHVLSKVFMGPDEDYYLLTNQVQDHIREHWHGYLPPGSCAIVPLPESVSGPWKKATKTGNKWGATTLACLPTMRVPENVRWHEDLIYNCMWSLLVAVEQWNKTHEEDKIDKLLMTGLATGCGFVPAEKCAEQMVLATKHYSEPVWGPGKPRWRDVIPRQNEIVETINLDKQRPKYGS